MTGATTRGVLFVHSAPRALCPHVEWAAGSVLGKQVALDWTAQPAAAGLFRAELSWAAAVGAGARLTSALRGWNHLRYEVTEEATGTSDGARWSHTPELGIFHAQTDRHGNVVVPEDRVRSALTQADDPARLRAALDLALGQAWDDELEPFRYAGAGAPVRWLHRVG
ncbi:conserved hypothetical protein [Beutenbergia cavernae DSM 12333]|uniref:DUF3145 domain-containing protein n=1 Tax=Beutenbergia cavernae (strain ATCC BAA-8 / DSM 12333 / CCUG 43141 / JCM 11478 / NBRC 16432 / NCIMB 13614 / HKI 0122) TaxID=471853 RepID=C5C4S8_BEUC1|nr:DUF3145 domain-containing protein [Beutenbergia cavernae]ACQ80056.1 conserved hypothetical protein [Beutenbergia cavernae DSM 12333]